MQINKTQIASLSFSDLQGVINHVFVNIRQHQGMQDEKYLSLIKLKEYCEEEIKKRIAKLFVQESEDISSYFGSLYM